MEEKRRVEGQEETVDEQKKEKQKKKKEQNTKNSQRSSHSAWIIRRFSLPSFLSEKRKETRRGFH